MALSIGQRLRQIVGDQMGAAVLEHNLEEMMKAVKDRASEPESMFYDPLSLYLGMPWIHNFSM